MCCIYNTYPKNRKVQYLTDIKQYKILNIRLNDMLILNYFKFLKKLMQFVDFIANLEKTVIKLKDQITDNGTFQ